MRVRLAIVAALATALPTGEAGAQTRAARDWRPEMWSVAASLGVEMQADSVGEGLDPLGLFGLQGTVRLHRFFCTDGRIALGGTKDGSETTWLSETRLRLDLRAALCRAVHRSVTILVALGPALGWSVFSARVRGATDSYDAIDIGASAGAGALFRIGAFALRAGLDTAVLRRFTLGLSMAFGLAL